MFEENRAPARQIRALQSDTTVRVYQAYSPAIAEPALAKGTFVAPFKRERMTWIKPSFLWMAYRCGYGRKPGQEHVLALDVTREGFEWALANASLSHYDSDVHADQKSWQAGLKASPVRIQWDPERDLHHRPLNYRSIQIGLSGEAVGHYVDEWITRITDVTPVMHEIAAHVAANRLPEALALLPEETPYVLPEDLAKAIDATA